MTETRDTALPKRTTPTWDMELLVSAASVFTLLQLPGWMDEGMLALRPRLDLDWDMLARLMYTYGKLAVLALAGAFAVHVAMRGYWIALVGMDSIYPEGVRWENLRLGPVRLRFVRERAPTMAERIERVDNRASIVFAVGISIAAIQVALLLLVGLGYAVSFGLARGLGWSWLMPNGVFLVIALVGLPFLLAATVDRRYGARLEPDGRAARAIGAVYSLYARVGYGIGGGNMLELVQSYAGRGRVMAWTLGAIVACGVVAAGQLMLQQGSFNLGDYARWPQVEVGNADSLLPEHYRDRDPPTTSLFPTIDSAFPEGTHVTLVVPFDPRRLPAQLEAACRDEWNAAESDGRRVALLACMSRWLDLRIDGTAVSTGLRYTADARTGQRAIAAVVPISALAPGEHQLSLRRAPPADGRRDRSPATHYRIVFWK